MKVYRLDSQVIVPKPIEDVFPFFDNPANLQELTPSTLGFKILTPEPITMAHGTCIDYVVSIMGFPTRWTSIIQLYDPPHQFVDTQLKGPYSLWHHTHRFSSVDGGTLIEDSVLYGVPFGILGQLVHPFIVKPQLKAIFSYRLKKMKSMFDADVSSARMTFS